MKTRYPADWPQRLVDIAEVIGPECALLLVEHVGGISSYVPKEPDSGHKLARIIGLPALRLLAEMYGGEWLEVPKYAAAKSKKVKIRQLLKDGTSARETALKADATERWVTMVSKEMRNDAQQLSLFNM
jgi:hypothetical protein